MGPRQMGHGLEGSPEAWELLLLASWFIVCVFFFSAKATKYEVQSFSEPKYVFVKKGHNYQGVTFPKKGKKKKKSRELNMSSMWDNQLD